MAEATERKGRGGVGARVVGVLSGYGMATTCLLLLGVLTWLSTLEQTDQTLLAVTRKYFHYENFIIFPEFNGKTVPLPLPNGFWVGAVFFLNLLLGTILRVRKTRKQIGILISHSGMLLLLLGAFVTQIGSTRGNMKIDPGEISDVATDFTDHVIEVAETAEGKVRKVHVIPHKHLKHLQPDDAVLFRMKNLPFDVRVGNYHFNTEPVPEDERTPDLAEAEVIDGFVLKPMPPDKKQAEANFNGCHAEIVTKEGEAVKKVLLSSLSWEAYPATFEFEGKVYTITIRRAVWKIPFDVRLDKFTHEFHPGTRRPRVFKSNVTRLERDPEDGSLIETGKLIEMNHPMRYDGFTFFQTNWGPQDDPNATEFYSVFEVVKNPADQWPLYSLIITGFGLLVHFLSKLVVFIGKQGKSHARSETPRA